MRPLIGLTTSTITAVESGTMDRFSIAALYCRAVAAAGGSPILIPSLGDPEAAAAIFPRLDGLLFTGGVDIHPHRYGQAVHPGCEHIDEDRDATEFALADLTRRSAIPVLGICRGIQLINVAWGGTLVQDLTLQRPGGEDHRASNPEPPRTAHTLTLEHDSRLAAALGVDRVPANSMHHQAVDVLAPGFAISARSEDGTVEAIELTDTLFVVAVQSHPEHLYQNDARWLGFFGALVDEARQASSSRTLALAH
ncbi:MAG: gamma-glutamyl-gamma-aminobutyrate hydrolase family protein [Chloroflexota bacterium]